MKKLLTKKLIFILILTILVSIIQLPLMANTNEENIIVKKADKEFMIYYKNISNNEFKFAFSNDENVEEGGLNLINSAKDTSDDTEPLNIAYVDAELFEQYFTTGSAYLWIKANNDFIVKADKIDLSKAIDDSNVNFVNNTTKRISVDLSQKEKNQQIINDVDTTVTVGKIVINPQEGANYYYQLIKLNDETIEENNLFDLAEQIKNGVTDKYEQLKTVKSFYDLYNELEPSNDDTNWIEVENNEILQPEDTKQGEKYIVWLKESNQNDSVIDIQFLTSIREYENKKVPTEKIIKETVNLPVTYDSIALFVVLGILIIAILVVVLLKIKSNKNEKK